MFIADTWGRSISSQNKKCQIWTVTLPLLDMTKNCFPQPSPKNVNLLEFPCKCSKVFSLNIDSFFLKASPFEWVFVRLVSCREHGSNIFTRCCNYNICYLSILQSFEILHRFREERLLWLLLCLFSQTPVVFLTINHMCCYLSLSRDFKIMI